MRRGCVLPGPHDMRSGAAAGRPDTGVGLVPAALGTRHRTVIAAQTGTNRTTICQGMGQGAPPAQPCGRQCACGAQRA